MLGTRYAVKELHLTQCIPIQSPYIVCLKEDWKIMDVYRLYCTKCQYEGFFFSLPHISDFLEKLGKSEYFSSINLATAYY